MREQLRLSLVKYSTKDNIGEAIDEWGIQDYTTRKKVDGRCECNQPIKHEVHIQNSITEKKLIVGSKCVDYFKIGISEEVLERLLIRELGIEKYKEHYGNKK